MDLFRNGMMIFHSCVKLPEGNHPTKSHETIIFLWVFQLTNMFQRGQSTLPGNVSGMAWPEDRCATMPAMPAAPALHQLSPAPPLAPLASLALTSPSQWENLEMMGAPCGTDAE